MVAPEYVLRAFDDGDFYDSLQPYRVTDEKKMPWAYRRDNPEQKFLHGDWAVYQDTPRMATAYDVFLPFRQDSGARDPKWILWDTSYPTTPGTRIENRDVSTAWGVVNLPHAFVDQALEGSGYATFSVWMPTSGAGNAAIGKFVPCLRTYRKVIFGRLYASYTGGLKQDTTVTPQPDGSIKSDLRGWWDPPSMSWKKVA